MERTIEDIGAKMDALGVWEAVAPYNWAVCPKGTVFPYFCCVYGRQPSEHFRAQDIIGRVSLSILHRSFERRRIEKHVVCTHDLCEVMVEIPSLLIVI